MAEIAKKLRTWAGRLQNVHMLLARELIQEAERIEFAEANSSPVPGREADEGLTDDDMAAAENVISKAIPAIGMQVTKQELKTLIHHIAFALFSAKVQATQSERAKWELAAQAQELNMGYGASPSPLSASTNVPRTETGGAAQTITTTPSSPQNTQSAAYIEAYENGFLPDGPKKQTCVRGKGDPPQDCDWPYCGCDESATRAYEIGKRDAEGLRYATLSKEELLELVKLARGGNYNAKETVGLILGAVAAKKTEHDCSGVPRTAQELTGDDGNGLRMKGKADDSPTARRHSSNDGALALEQGTSRCGNGVPPAAATTPSSPDTQEREELATTPFNDEDLAWLRKATAETRVRNIMVSKVELCRLIATISSRDKAIEGRDKRREQLLEWLQERIGTAWECTNCGYSTYHSHGFECDECATEMPLEHVLAFKLHVPLSDPSGAEPSDRACAVVTIPQEREELLAVAAEANAVFANDMSSPDDHIDAHRRLDAAVRAFRKNIPSTSTVREFLALGYTRPSAVVAETGVRELLTQWLHDHYAKTIVAWVSRGKDEKAPGGFLQNWWDDADDLLSKFSIQHLGKGGK